MHGWVQTEGERSCKSPQSTISWHMHPTVIAANSNSFIKDGRKISVGDCALFKPAKDSPPFIGLIRCLTLSKENNLQLGVNWLYRPAEIKLGKGILVEGAPNEIFYSFHKDEIPAASLLHPCKVAFLPRGVGPPAGTSSFVCRRVYDIANKCLWWLTDQDYVKQRQDEVDQLLYKTRVEMHAMLQAGGHSPKQVNGPTSASQLKPASDSGQNSGTSLHPQVKGKKRERGDHGADPVKRERSLRSDDANSFQYKTEGNLKSEIARITEEKGGLVDLEGVEKLIQLMQPDRTERKTNLVNRNMLAGVMAATDKVDCLNQFVQLRGLPILDEWLQDIHKGKIGDGNSLKDCDKSVEEFLLVLLRALDKLPINLHALQMCNIGRSVNHLRSHKNLEIQRKARSLVDTWKKRVEAEMISIDTKSGLTQGASVWSSKSRLPDASHGGSRTPTGSDVAIKSSITQNSASKTTSASSSHGEYNIKSTTSSPGHVKPASSLSCGKDSHPRVSVGGIPDVPLVREDRSSSSNQSHNYSQSFSGKEDGKSTMAGSMTVNKMSMNSNRNRKNSGFPGTSITGSPKEICSSRSPSAHKSTALEKLPQSAFSSERVLEGAITEGSSHKIIVKIPNRVRSPAQGVAGGSLEDSTCMSSRISSPVLLDKHEHFDRTSEDKSDTYRCNVASDMNVSPGECISRSVEGAVSPAALPDEERGMTSEDSRKLTEGPTTNQLRPGRLHVSSFSPMNALIESCAKYSEANRPLSLDDDVGMNLLASVATGEMSRSDLVSPTNSTDRSTPAVEEFCIGNEEKSKSSPEDNVTAVQSHLSNDAKNDEKKQSALDGSRSADGLHLLKHAKFEFSSDRKCAPSHTAEDILSGTDHKHFDSSMMDMGINADPNLEIRQKSNKTTSTSSLKFPMPAEKARDGEPKKEEIHEEYGISSNVGTDCISNCKSGGVDVMVTEEKASTEGKPVEDVASHQSCEGEFEKDTNEGLDVKTDSQQKLKSEFAEEANDEKLQQTTVSEAINGDKGGEPDEKVAKICVSKFDKLNFDMEVNRNAVREIHSSADNTLNELKSHHTEANTEKETQQNISMHERVCPASVDHEAQQNVELRGSKSANVEQDDTEECASTSAEASSSAEGASDRDGKMKFDLNEGFNADDGKYGEPVSDPNTAHMINSLPMSVNSVPSVHSASVTVAAAAKGPFVPPEDLLRSKGELGWKGSAATSAFRPAEPRKVLEAPLGSTNMPFPDASASKRGCIHLDIDLNVPDERVLEEMASRDSAMAVHTATAFSSDRAMLNEPPGSITVRGFGGLDLDLNQIDEVSDSLNSSTTSKPQIEGSILHVKPFGSFPTGDVQRDFDLNDGPGVDDATPEQFSIHEQIKGGVPPQLSSMGLRMNDAGQGSYSSWFMPGNTYSTIAIPSVLPDRGEHPFPGFPPSAPQRTFVHSAVTTFSPDIYRGSVLSSSPAMPFPSSPFQFPVFPFGTSFPLPSATFSVGAPSYVDSSSGPRLYAPPVHSQLLRPVGSVTPQFQRPHMVCLPEVSSSGGLENRKWSRLGLDLNAGPGAMESEVREEKFPLLPGQHSVASSQALAQEQGRMYSVSSGIIKRKEPDEGWG